MRAVFVFAVAVTVVNCQIGPMNSIVEMYGKLNKRLQDLLTTRQIEMPDIPGIQGCFLQYSNDIPRAVLRDRIPKAFGVLCACLGKIMTDYILEGKTNQNSGFPGIPGFPGGIPGLPGGIPGMPGGIPGLPQTGTNGAGIPGFPNGIPGLPQTGTNGASVPGLPNGIPGLPQTGANSASPGGSSEGSHKRNKRFFGNIPGLPQTGTSGGGIPSIPGFPQIGSKGDSTSGTPKDTTTSSQTGSNGINIPGLPGGIPGLPQTGTSGGGMPGIPGLPQNGNGSGSLPTIPSILGIPGLPQTGKNGSAIPGIPGIPGLPQTGNNGSVIPGIPGIPGLPQTGNNGSGIPNIPGIPGFPQTGTNGIGIPGVPGIPGFPQTGNTGGEVPGIPNIPGGFAGLGTQILTVVIPKALGIDDCTDTLQESLMIAMTRIEISQAFKMFCTCSGRAIMEYVKMRMPGLTRGLQALDQMFPEQPAGLRVRRSFGLGYGYGWPPYDYNDGYGDFGYGNYCPFY